MAIVSTRFFYEDKIRQYEKLEAKGKLGPTQAFILEEWRKIKAKVPNLRSIGYSNGEAFVWQVYPERSSK